MKTATIWLIVATSTAILIAAVNFIKGNFSSPPPYHVALMAGQIVGLNLIPFCVGGVFFLFKRRLIVFFIGWLIAFLIFGYGAVYQAFYDASHSGNPRSLTSSLPSKKEFLFSAQFAPWKVSFVGTPKESQLNHGVSGQPAIQAEIEYPDGSMCRAEIYSVPATMPYNADVADSMLRRLAARDGLSDIALVSEQTKLGPKHSMRGGKILEGRNGSFAVTYFTQVLFTNGSFISMTAGAPASSYPTPEITHFLNSVKK